VATLPLEALEHLVKVMRVQMELLVRVQLVVVVEQVLLGLLLQLHLLVAMVGLE
jgi:hypothetical protein